MEKTNTYSAKVNNGPSLGGSMFYLIVLLAIVPMITGLIGDYFMTHFLSEEEVSVFA